MDGGSQLSLFDDSPLIVDLGIEKIEQKTYNLRCRIDAKVIVTGQSGTRYEFSGAGAVVEVAEADVSGLLAKTLGKRLCCGNLQAGDNAMFEPVT